MANIPHKNKTAQELEDEEFARTGSFTIKMDIDIEITEEDMLRHLVNETEGKMIKPVPASGHNNN
jgi:hypothetical protein